MTFKMRAMISINYTRFFRLIGSVEAVIDDRRQSILYASLCNVMKCCVHAVCNVIDFDR